MKSERISPFWVNGYQPFSAKDPATVSKWCTNTAQPSLETLLEIARVLEVDVKDLLHSTREGIQYIKIQQP